MGRASRATAAHDAAARSLPFPSVAPRVLILLAFVGPRAASHRSPPPSRVKYLGTNEPTLLSSRLRFAFHSHTPDAPARSKGGREQLSTSRLSRLIPTPPPSAPSPGCCWGLVY